MIGSILFNLIFGILTFIAYFILTVRQMQEVGKPKTWYSGIRMMILVMFAFTTLTLVPSIVYQYLRLIGIESELLRSIVTITSRLNGLTGIVLIYVIYLKRFNTKE